MKYIFLLFILFGSNGCFFHYVSVAGDDRYPLFQRKKIPMAVQIETEQDISSIINPNLNFKRKWIQRNKDTIKIIVNKILFYNNLKKEASADYKLKFISRVQASDGTSIVLMVLTLGIFPAMRIIDFPLELQVYYKDELLKKYQYGYRHYDIVGWLTIPPTIFIMPFNKNMSTSLEPEFVSELLLPTMDRVAYDLANDFNIDLTSGADNKSLPRRVEIFRGGVFAISATQVTINFKQRAGLRPGLLVFFEDADGKVISTGKIEEINATNAKASFTGIEPTKGLEVVAYKEVF